MVIFHRYVTIYQRVSLEASKTQQNTASCTETQVAKEWDDMADGWTSGETLPEISDSQDPCLFLQLVLGMVHLKS